MIKTNVFYTYLQKVREDREDGKGKNVDYILHYYIDTYPISTWIWNKDVIDLKERKPGVYVVKIKKDDPLSEEDLDNSKGIVIAARTNENITSPDIPASGKFIVKGKRAGNHKITLKLAKGGIGGGGSTQHYEDADD